MSSRLGDPKPQRWSSETLSKSELMPPASSRSPMSLTSVRTMESNRGMIWSSMAAAWSLSSTHLKPTALDSWASLCLTAVSGQTKHCHLESINSNVLSNGCTWSGQNFRDNVSLQHTQLKQRYRKSNTVWTPSINRGQKSSINQQVVNEFNTRLYSFYTRK